MSPRLAALACLALVALASQGAAHDDSVSRTLLVVEGDVVSHFARVQTLSLLEVLPLDRDGNGLLSEREAQDGADAVTAYLQATYELRPVRAGRVGEPLPAERVAYQLVDELADALAFRQWIELELRRPAPHGVTALSVTSRLFVDTSPGHRDRVDVVFAEERAPDGPLDGVRLQAVLDGGRPSLVFDSGRRLGSERLALGAEGLARMPALLGCALMLLLAARSAGSALAAVVVYAGALLACSAARSTATELPSLSAVAPLGLALLGAWPLLDRSGRSDRRGLWSLAVEALAFGALQGLALAQVRGAPPAEGPMPSASTGWEPAALASALAVLAWVATAGCSRDAAEPSRGLRTVLATTAVALGTALAWRAL